MRGHLAARLDELFYGLRAAVGALVAMAVVRLGRRFITDVPLTLLAIASGVLTLAGAVGFVFVLVGAGLVYSLVNGAGRAVRQTAAINPLAGALIVGAI